MNTLRAGFYGGAERVGHLVDELLEHDGVRVDPELPALSVCTRPRARSSDLGQILTSAANCFLAVHISSLDVDEGDELYGVADERGIYLTPLDPEFQKKVKAFERTRKRYRNALNELSK